MKKLMIIALLGCTIMMTGQEQQDETKKEIEKGTWNLGGNFSTSFANTDFDGTGQFSENKTRALNFFPRLGYAVSKNIIVGAGVGYGYSNNENTTIQDGSILNTGEVKSNTLSVFPYIRAYKGVGKDVLLHLQGEVRYARVWSDFEQNGNSTVQTNKGDDILIGLRPGITFFIAPKFALETNLGFIGYSKSNRNDDDGTRSTETEQFNFSLNSADLFFGLSYYF